MRFRPPCPRCGDLKHERCYVENDEMSCPRCKWEGSRSEARYRVEKVPSCPRCEESTPLNPGPTPPTPSDPLKD